MATPWILLADAADRPVERCLGVAVEPEEAHGILRPVRGASLGAAFSINPYRGCGHGCTFCYVREYPHPVHGMDDWGTWVSPKVNAPELLWRERHRLRGQGVFLAAGTDPYQPLETRWRLTRRCLEVLLEATDAEVHLHTRSPLILQDLDLLTQHRERVSVSFSLSTDDEAIRRIVEPHAPALSARWAALERLSARGIPTGLSVAPLLPVRDPAALGQRARAAGVQSAWVGRLRLLKADPFRAILRQQGWCFVLSETYRDTVAQGILQTLDPPGPTPRRRRGRGAYRATPIPAPLLAPRSLFEALEADPEAFPAPDTGAGQEGPCHCQSAPEAPPRAAPWENGGP